MSDPDDLLGTEGDSPRRFGDYLIHGLLGEGGMARIYAGEEVLSHRRVAIKVLRSEFARSEQGRRQFLTEMSILANIDDPHIVRCLLCTQIEQKPVMVLEQLDGWTLREMLKQRVALPWTEVAAIALQIAKALHTAHSRRPPVVHRDLKPENVMCLRDGRVKVMDFGIAKIIQTLAGSTTHPIGTLQYMSPEHIDAGPVDGRSDLFSLGLLMWEMLAGRPPFVSDAPRALLEQICTEPTPALPDQVREAIPPHFEQLIVELLAKLPDQRPGTAAEVIARLQPDVGVATHTPPPAPARPATEPGPTPPPPPASPQAKLDTAEIVDEARKSPLQRQVEARIDEAAEAVSRFGQATSALIVRVLVGLMILPAAALVFVGVPALFAVVDLYLLAEEEGVVMFESDFETYARPELLPTLLVASFVFVRTCWIHHRAPGRGVVLKLWLLFGLLPLAAWTTATAVEFGTESDLAPSVHYTCVAFVADWLAITLAWATGRITSLILRRLELAREAR